MNTDLTDETDETDKSFFRSVLSVSSVRSVFKNVNADRTTEYELFFKLRTKYLSKKSFMRVVSHRHEFASASS